MKKIVIIGGGFAGTRIAKSLEKNRKTEITLIDAKEYYEFTPSIIKTITNPRYSRKIEVKHEEYLKNTKVIIGRAIRIEKKAVILEEGKKINYDYLIITTGSNYNEIFKEGEKSIISRSKQIKESYHKIRKAKKIVIIGGGIVGVELAGEMINEYPEKKVVIIHSDKRLMGKNNNKTSEYAETYLKKKGIEIILKTKANNINNEGIVRTDKGKVKSDFVIMATGIIPNSKILGKKKYIEVNKYLQVIGKEKVYSAGDVNDADSEKSAQNAERQADIVIKNIQRDIKGIPLTKYLTKKRVSVISLGRTNGIIEYGDVTITGIIPAILKKIIEIKTMIKYKNPLRVLFSWI
ncbi:hypothetical protein COU61_02595 [Candidatus Pacearchaeota archaeon CG10_big_fil_rev_8_21_14_0_10_35_13]|nr:MAG: hypothetical protein COU61_02595 [Candidatus Pacearchaeota archaeon CG10_big_fil_rev_8_21_14_0_10_35_13]